MKITTNITAAVAITAEGDEELARVNSNNRQNPTPVSVRVVNVRYSHHHAPSVQWFGMLVKKDGTIGRNPYRGYGADGPIKALVKANCPDGFRAE